MKRFCAACLLIALFLCGCEKGTADLTGERWELDKITPEDLGCFMDVYPTQRSEYTLLEGSPFEMTVCCLEGEKDGPVVYVVGGIHGDELAGWYAGTLLKQADLYAGTLYILAPANLYGAQENQRETKSGRDLNRAFPGKESGWDAQQIANAIFNDVKEKAPTLLLDLHEAHPGTEHADALGNSVIVENMRGDFGAMVLEMLLRSEQGELWSQPLTLYAAPPEGSINQVVSATLDIQAITVETLRSESMEQRVKNHLELVEYILKQYGMLGK